MNEPETSELDVAWIEQQLRELGAWLGLPLRVVAETGSTNADAREAAARGAPHGAVFAADAQTAGRGRMGRRWHSPHGTNLYFSAVLRPSFPVSRLPAIAIAVGLATAEGIEALVPRAGLGLKWPNDVVLRGRKLAGILVEGSMCADRCEHVVVGVGVNVLQTEFDPEIRSVATSLTALGEPPSRERVLVAVLRAMSERYRQFESDGLGPMLEAVRARDVVKGRRVRVGGHEGVAEGISGGGELCVRMNGGALRLVHAGDVELLAPF
ncbi:MAG: biotin--[acetyl-CoA-carboxylase] ligase [Polyangiaceae bacterium]|nr:biotin--[acetyl-CoA-carboxylase] ligase [Polyangiaceae bacterium]